VSTDHHNADNASPSSLTRQDRIERAAQELAVRHTAQRQGPTLSADGAPADLDEALAVQQRVMSLLDARTGGWKCALPASGNIILAPIYHHRISNAASVNDCASPAHDGNVEIEPEIAYMIGMDLPPRATPYTTQEIVQAIASTHIVFELIGSRYHDRSKEPFANKLADCLANHGLFIGPAIDPALAQDPSLATIALTLRDGHAELGNWNGKHPDGHPLQPLLWLANHLAANGSGLKQGEIVTTGSYHGVIRVPVDTVVSMQFGTLGKLDVTIRATT
jgi:2-keto-4-pentenoate hydratase